MNAFKALLDRDSLRPALVPIVSRLARSQGLGVKEIFYDQGVWMHETEHGYFGYHQPYVRLDLRRLDEIAKTNFFWGYKPRPGDVVMDVGAGVGEETLTFSRAVGTQGRVVCIEAHPRTYRCLQKLIQYNHLNNVTALHHAATNPSCTTATIEDSKEYLGNRIDAVHGFSVPATTIDEIHKNLGLGRVDFLKMNIEGAERLAVQGMAETLKQTRVLCISCHDFLAEARRDEELRTKATVQQFLRESGFRIVARTEETPRPYLLDQVWAYNEGIGDDVGRSQAA
jgi:FkbM family methyltransferase